jgi:hypothetical protein
MNGWHALAAILTVARMQGATHRIAAPHRLLGRSHTDAIERIARQSHAEYNNQHPSSKAHTNQTRGSPCMSQDRVVTERPARARESRAHHVVECGRYRQRDPGQGFETSFIAFCYLCYRLLSTVTPKLDKICAPNPLFLLRIAEIATRWPVSDTFKVRYTVTRLLGRLLQMPVDRLARSSAWQGRGPPEERYIQ